MKWDSFSDSNILIISQSPHGNFQAGKAMDFAHLKGNMPAPKAKITASKPQSNPRQSYFYFGLDNWLAEFVHTKPVRAVGSLLSKGQALWASTWHHVHATIKVDGKWQYVLSVIDWSKVQVYWLKVGQKHPIWTNKGTYPDIELPPYPATIVEMINLQKNLKLKVIATIPLNVRKDPNTSAPVVGKLEPDSIFETRVVAQGQNIEGNSTWYKAGEGWVSGKWLQELTLGNPELEQEISRLRNEVTGLKTNNAQLADQNRSLTESNSRYKPAYDAAKLIQSIK